VVVSYPAGYPPGMVGGSRVGRETLGRRPKPIALLRLPEEYLGRISYEAVGRCKTASGREVVEYVVLMHCYCCSVQELEILHASSLCVL